MRNAFEWCSQPHLSKVNHIYPGTVLLIGAGDGARPRLYKMNAYSNHSSTPSTHLDSAWSAPCPGSAENSRRPLCDVSDWWHLLPSAKHKDSNRSSQLQACFRSNSFWNWILQDYNTVSAGILVVRWRWNNGDEPTRTWIRLRVREKKKKRSDQGWASSQAWRLTSSIDHHSETKTSWTSFFHYVAVVAIDQTEAGTVDTTRVWSHWRLSRQRWRSRGPRACADFSFSGTRRQFPNVV